MNKSTSLLAVAIAGLVAVSVAGPAMARMGGSIGNGGHMSGTMPSGTLPPAATQVPSAQSSTPMTSSGMRNHNGGSNSSNVFRALDSPIPSIANSPSP